MVPLVLAVLAGVANLAAYATLWTAVAWFTPSRCHEQMDRQSLMHLAEAYASYQRGGAGLWELVFSQEPQCALPYFKQAVALHPKHAEAHLALAMVYAAENEPAPAITHTAAAFALGEPVGLLLETFRLQPSPSLTTGLISHVLAWATPAILSGPIINMSSPHSAAIWVRTRDAAQVAAIGVPAESPGTFIQSSPAESTDQSDHTVTLHLNGLRADTIYTYWITINGRPTPLKRTLRTFPEQDSPSVFSIAFGGCSDYVPPNLRIYQTIASRSPLAFLTLGDNAYIDGPTNPNLQRFSYARLQADPHFNRLTSTVSTSAVWDDHDFSTDNSWGGPDPFVPAWKPMVWQIFEQNWITPNAARPAGTPGVWQEISVGNVDLFLLDSRYYRVDPNSPHASMLGAQQEAWLLQGLASSKATFKIIASPVLWSTTTVPSSDTWDGYPEERQRIFDWIRTQRIDGVILISSDRHRSDVWQIPQPSAYDLFEFESGRLTNDMPHAEAPDAVFSFNKKPSFGLLTFDFSKADPEAQYSIVDIDNQTIFGISVKASQLTTIR